MEIKRKIELFSATNRRFVVRRQTPEQEVVCATCGNGMVTSEQVAKIFKISQRSVFKLLETGTVHFTELAEGGAALICINSFADVSDGPDHEDPKSIR